MPPPAIETLTDLGQRAVAERDAMTTIWGVLNQINHVLNTLIPFIVGLSIFVIIWGIFNYLTHGDDEEKRGEAKKFIIFGIGAIFIMISIWGLVNILSNTFNIDRSPPPAPSLFPERNI